MSFDLSVFIGNTTKIDQQTWVNNLKNIGIECKFPDGFIIGNELDGSIIAQCRLNPPLVNEPTEFDDYELELYPQAIDKELIENIKENSKDVSLINKLQNLTKEISLYSSAGRDNYALIIQCYMAATLANSCDGVLFDPQEFGAVHGEKAYHVAHAHSRPSHAKPKMKKDNSFTRNQSAPIKQSLFSWFAQSFGFSKNIPLPQSFYQYAISAKNDLDKTLRNNNSPSGKELRTICSKASKETWSKFSEKASYHTASSLTGLALKSILFKVNNKCIQWYIDKAIYTAKKAIDKEIKVDKYDTIIAENRFESYIALACAKTFSTPNLPDRKILYQGLLYVDEVFSVYKGSFYECEQSSSVRCALLAILIDDIELANKFLYRRKTLNDKKEHCALLKEITQEISEFGKGNLTQELEKKFFTFFNAYRLPLSGVQPDEFPLVINPLGNYLFSWLYLSVFLNRQETTWKELREIMTS